MAQELRSESLNTVQNSGEASLSCELNKLSALISSLSGVQNEMCGTGVENCKIDCENKLGEVKRAFRQCFSISNNYSIDEILQKSNSPPAGEEVCYREMRAVAKKYKDQSLNKQSLLREELKAKDIVKCEDIQKAKTQQALNSFALNVCHQAQVQKQAQEEEKAQEEQRQVQVAKQQVSGLSVDSAIKSQAISQSVSGSSNGKSSLGAEALAGAKTLSESTDKEDERKVAKSPKQKAKDKSKSASSKKLNEQKEKTSVVQNESQNKEKKDKIQTKQRKDKTLKQLLTPAKAKQDSLTGSLTGDQLKLSDKLNPIKTAQASENCPISMPKIRTSVVFQSVEAPQIEPRHKQELQRDSNNPNFTSYDLVRGKSAGILVKMTKTDCWDDNKKFDLKMYINNKSIKDVKCLPGDNLSASPLVAHSNIDFCSFSSGDFKKEHGKLARFIILPMEYEGPLNGGLKIPIKIEIIIKPKQSIASFKEFTVNVIYTKSLYVALMPMTEACVSDKIKNVNTVKPTNTILSSVEVKHYLPYIFPLGEFDYKPHLIDSFKKWHFRYGIRNAKLSFARDFDEGKNGQITMRSKCKGVKITDAVVSVGMMFNFLALVEILNESSRDRLFLIVSEDYMKQHYKENICGFRPDLPGFLGGNEFAKTGAIVDNCPGTLLHELAHTIGQEKEFYEESNETCKKFREGNSNFEECGVYTETGILGLKHNRFFWKKNKYSIMNNIPFLRSIRIDRETFQKTVAFLRTSPPPPPLPLNVHPDTGELLPPYDPERPGVRWIIPKKISADPKHSGVRRIIPKIKISAVYNKKSKKFVYFKKGIGEKTKPSPEFDKSLYKNLKRDFKYINFKLVRKRNNKVQGKPYIVLVPQDMPFRALYGNGGGKEFNSAILLFLLLFLFKGKVSLN